MKATGAYVRDSSDGRVASTPIMIPADLRIKQPYMRELRVADTRYKLKRELSEPSHQVIIARIMPR